MFPKTFVEELTSEAIYEFKEYSPVYLKLLIDYERLLDSNSALDMFRTGMDSYEAAFWWVINENWQAYGTPNPDIPPRWLAIAKRALQWDYMPSNFHLWALRILESFDLERYNAAYHLPSDELAAIRRDLPVVLEGLRRYPPEKLARPVDEENWSYVDQ